MELTDRELCTILAALRNWQAITSNQGGNDPRELQPEHFSDGCQPLDEYEIDDLCERLNC